MWDPTEHDLTDEELWRRATAGDGDAFGTIYDRHVDAVFRHCRRLSPNDAEDATSVVFLEAWRNSRRVNFVAGSARPWLLVVATNVVRNTTRARRRYERLLARLPSPEAVSDVADEVVANLMEINRTDRLHRAIRGLRRAEREVIALCDLAQLTQADAALALAIPIGTVKSRLTRARAHLKQALSDAAGGAATSVPPRVATITDTQGGNP